jgi:endonuclease YncB( thermonuclease family)
VAVRCLLLAPLFLAQGALGAEFIGRVVSIQEGDSLTVLVSGKRIAVRLTDIDAPERGQPFATRSRQSLAQLCANKDARVRTKGKDRFGRSLGRVVCSTVDANAEQVLRGMARVFDRHVADRSLYDFQDEARSAQRGLWADPQPTPPWVWRQTHRRGEM